MSLFDMNKNELFRNPAALRESLSALRQSGRIMGFVPTMGALHEGHLSLVDACLAQCDICVLSVFVNPRQFNDSQDFEKYPQNLQADQDLLFSRKRVWLFFPSAEDVFKANIPEFNLYGLDERLEGASRPGHFLGVAQVVYALFQIVEPAKAFFGMKDFQQLMVIRNLVKQHRIPVQIISCPTLRNTDGLALSSRNSRLSDTQQKEALIIYQTLCFVKEQIESGGHISLVESKARAYFDQGSLQLDYLAILDPNTMYPLATYDNSALCCIAAYCGPVRLIDNLQW